MELDFYKEPQILSTVVDAMADDVFTVDAQRHFVAWSTGAERITDCASEDVVGQPCRLMEGPNCKGFSTVAELLENLEPLPNGICNQECKVVDCDDHDKFTRNEIQRR